MIKKLSKAALNFAKADVVFYLLPLLMLLLIAGTVAQKPMGLYQAQKMFFGSFYFWAGPFPLPGGYTLLGIFSLSLLSKFILQSQWTLKKSGINLTHCGALVLLFGSLITALTSRESYMVIPESSETAYTYDYHQRQLYVFENDLLKKTINFENIEKEISGLPFALNIETTCANCAIIKREKNDETLQGMARFMELQNAPVSKEPEANLSGIQFKIRGLSEGNGTYIAFEGMPEPILLKHKDKTYKIIFGKQQNLLPFSLRLVEFTKKTYPGTEKASGYSSKILVVDNGLEWPATIEMNKPLRYKGYTFYQSSFEQAQNSQTTILSVVENKGALFPYIGAIIMAAGLILHIALVIRNRDIS